MLTIVVYVVVTLIVASGLFALSLLARTPEFRHAAQ